MLCQELIMPSSTYFREKGSGKYDKAEPKKKKGKKPEKRKPSRKGGF